MPEHAHLLLCFRHRKKRLPANEVAPTFFAWLQRRRDEKALIDPEAGLIAEHGGGVDQSVRADVRAQIRLQQVVDPKRTPEEGDRIRFVIRKIHRQLAALMVNNGQRDGSRSLMVSDMLTIKASARSSLAVPLREELDCAHHFFAAGDDIETGCQK